MNFSTGARRLASLACLGAAIVCGSLILAAQNKIAGRPEDHLPSNITPLTAFGERAGWSPDGVAISRKRMKIAWANTHEQVPDALTPGESALYTADVVDQDGTPTLTGRKEILRAHAPECTLEAQDFRNDDHELIYTCYRAP